jgi:L-ribulokinase
MFAATAAGLYPRIEHAQKAMVPATERSVYRPDPARARLYDRPYQDYLALGAFVGGEPHPLGARRTAVPGRGVPLLA